MRRNASPHDQAVTLLGYFFVHVPSLDLTAALYDDCGRVQRLLAHPPHRVASLDHYEHIAAWLRYVNATRPANIWVRPSATLPAHPFVLLDDLPTSTAMQIADRYTAAVVETSPGNCQCWLLLALSLPAALRQDVSRFLSRRYGSDPGAISEPRWGRLPGFRNRKPGATTWTNMLRVSAASPYDPAACLSCPPPPVDAARRAAARRPDRPDCSRKEFWYAVHALRAGVPPTVVEQRVADHVAATFRRKHRDYPARTVRAAQAYLARAAP